MSAVFINVAYSFLVTAFTDKDVAILRNCEIIAATILFASIDVPHNI